MFLSETGHTCPPFMQSALFGQVTDRGGITASNPHPCREISTLQKKICCPTRLSYTPDHPCIMF
uniref:Uncharacterized protein n=1 Tax=Anguilla anguilla TaxID=7936 RepID=A0A0E9PJ76_ANGAN